VSERRVFSLDDEEAALLASVLPPARPAPARLEAILRRLVAGPPPAPRTRRLRLAMVGAVLLVSGASLAGYRIFEARRPSPPPSLVKPPERFREPPPIRTVVPAAPAPLPPSPARNKTRARPALALSDLERETAHLAAPMAKIRRGGDLVSALADIDRYLRRFPAGTLRPEAQLLRVDALLLLHRSSAALAALDELDLDDNRRGLELRLVRGELRAQTDCRAALPDFDAVIRAAPDADLSQRARRDRADCLRRAPVAP
jgi:hypothetical protein